MLGLMLLGSMACGGGEEEMARDIQAKPYAALPANANYLYGLRPKIIASNALVDELRKAMGKQHDDLLFTSKAREVGLDPQQQIDAMVYGLYGGSWAMVALGQFEEPAVIKAISAQGEGRIQIQVTEKNYAGHKYYVINRSAEGASDSLYVCFPATGRMLAASNENLMMNSIVVSRGKADSMLSDKTLGPLLQKIDPAAAGWVAGLSQGTLDRSTLSVRFSQESLGNGVHNYYGQLNLTPQLIAFNGQFECDNAEKANRQAENFAAVQAAFARNYFQIFGKGVIDFSNKVQIKPEQNLIKVSVELKPEDVDTIAQDTAAALKSGGGLPREIMDQLQGSASEPSTQPATSQSAE